MHITAKAAKAAEAEAEALVAEMAARAARERLSANVGVGITGVAEQEGKPAGTVHIAVASAESASDTSQHFRGARSEIKWRAAITALSLLRLHVLNMNMKQ